MMPVQAMQWHKVKGNIFATMAIVAVIAYLFWNAPAGGAFYWSDAPRHALNGVFVKDFLQAAPFDNPAGFAYDYYAKYPALTILFYPPLFYFLSAPFFLIFGVSHETALLVVFVHYVAFGLGCYRLGLFWFTPILSLLFTLLIVSAPEIAFWGRQVMLEIPAYAFLVWSAVAFIQYRNDDKSFHLYLSVALLVLALYTKISTGFLALVYAWLLIQSRGRGIFKNKHIYYVSLLAILALLPLIFMTVKFGQANIQSVSGIKDAAVSRASLDGWVWYLKQIPHQVGWPVAIASVVGLVLAFSKESMPKRDRLFWLSWLLVGYFFFSSIDLKEARHSVFILVPVIFFAVTAFNKLPTARASVIAVGLLLAFTLTWTIVKRPVFFVSGYAQAVDYIAKNAPQSSVVMFSGTRDGAFIFNMRSREDRNDLSVLRADKVLLKVAVRRELGVKENTLSEADMSSLMNRYGVHYIVMQPGFWTDLEVMQRFENMLKTPQFVEVTRIKTPANFNSYEKELIIYKNLGPVAAGPIDLKIDLPIINRTVEGAIGK